MTWADRHAAALEEAHRALEEGLVTFSAAQATDLPALVRAALEHALDRLEAVEAHRRGDTRLLPQCGGAASLVRSVLAGKR